MNSAKPREAFGIRGIYAPDTKVAQSWPKILLHSWRVALSGVLWWNHCQHFHRERQARGHTL